MQSKLSPKEIAIDKLVKADPEKLITKVRDDIISSPVQVYNLKREGRIINASEKGIDSCRSDLANILNCIYKCCIYKYSNVLKFAKYLYI